MTTPCEQSERIFGIEKDVKRLIRIIDDKESGSPGLYQTVLLLASTQIEQTKNIDKLINTVDALRVSGIRTDTEDKLISTLSKEKNINRRWIIGLSISNAVGIGLFIIKMLL
jgi:hypothetical protein